MRSISPLSPADRPALDEALALVRRVFMAYEAPGYSPGGVAEFMAYIEPEALAARLAAGGEVMLCCREDEVLAGVLAYRGADHISLLFVDGAYHRRGIARALVATMAARIRKAGGVQRVTVNSSPYAQAAYRRLGFAPTAAEQTTNGIRYIPMCAPLAALPG